MLLLMENVFWWAENHLKTYNIRKIANGQGNDYTTGCLLDDIYFKVHCKLIGNDLSKKQK